VQFAAHWHPAIYSRGILAIRNILGVQGDGPLHVSAFRELARYWTFCARRVLTLPKITVKPALIPTVGRKKIRPFRREIGALEEVGSSKLFDRSHTVQYGVRYLLYDETGGQVELHMSVVTFDGQQGFQQCGLTVAPPCEDPVLIRSHRKSLLGSEEKQCCLFRGGFSFRIYQGNLKLSESPESSGQIPTCAAWLRGSRFQC
jgi:hypothetical protein